jgi:flagellar protein FliS
MLHRNAIRAYQEAERDFLIDGADAHGLVEILFTELIASLKMAKNGLEDADLSTKSSGVSKALSIIHVLATSLDFDKGGEVAISLAQLYEWSRRRIIEASRDNIAAYLEEVLGAISEIADAWRSIAVRPA